MGMIVEMATPKYKGYVYIGLILFTVPVLLGLALAKPVLGIFNGVGIWIAAIALIVIVCAVLGYGFMGVFRGLLIDGRNMLSLSKLQMVLWTVIVISGLIAAAIANMAYGKDPLNITIPPELWLLMGINTTSLVASPIIKSTKQDVDGLLKNKNPEDAEWSDLFRGEETANANRLDLGKVQMFYLTLIIAFAYAVQIMTQLSQLGPLNPTGLSEGFQNFPAISSGMVALLGVSNAGYLAYKATKHGQPTEQPAPTVGSSTAVDNSVTLVAPSPEAKTIPGSK